MYFTYVFRRNIYKFFFNNIQDGHAAIRGYPHESSICLLRIIKKKVNLRNYFHSNFAARLIKKNAFLNLKLTFKH